MLKFKVSGSELYDRVYRLSPLIKQRNNEDYSSVIRFVVTEFGVHIHYFSGLVSVFDKCSSVHIVSSGNKEFLVPADTLISFLGKKKVDLEFSVSDENNLLEVKFKGGTFKTAWLDPKSYPVLFDPPSTSKLTIRADAFVPILKRSFNFLYVDKQDKIIGLDKVCLEVRNNVLNVVCTDKFRLYRLQKEINPTPDVRILIARDAADAIYSYFSDVEAELRISSYRGKMFFETSDVVISALEFEERYPDYIKVFDSYNPDTFMTVDSKVFKKVIDSFSFIDEKLLDISISNNLNISCTDLKGRVQLEDVVPSLEKSGNEYKFKASKTNLTSIIKTLSEGTIKIEYSNPAHALRFFNPKNPEEVALSTTYVDF